MKKILYVGAINEGQTCRERMNALQDLGHEVRGINSGKMPSLPKRVIDKIARLAGFSPDTMGLNRQIISQMQKEIFDVLWVDKGTQVRAKTLQLAKQLQPSCRLVHLNPDDPFGHFSKGWETFLKAIPCYDVHFVSRTPNISEYQSFGGKNIYAYDRSFSKKLHRPLQLSGEDLAKYRAIVGFIGSYARERVRSIAHLIQNGVPVAVWGNGWQKGEYWEIIRPHFRGGGRMGEEYVKAINGMDIALHFLRRENRDEQDSRTFEIPACGVFMLAERSPKHEEFFQDGEEAVFFDSPEDLLDKVRYYLTHPNAAQQIAIAGWQRCLQSGYDHENRMQEMINICLKSTVK